MRRSEKHGRPMKPQRPDRRRKPKRLCFSRYEKAAASLNDLLTAKILYPTLHKTRNFFRAKTASKRFRVSDFSLLSCVGCYCILFCHCLFCAGGGGSAAHCAIDRRASPCGLPRSYAADKKENPQTNWRFLLCRWWGSNPHVLLAQGILSFYPHLPSGVIQ